MKVPRVPVLVPLTVSFLHRHDFIDRHRTIRTAFQTMIQEFLLTRLIDPILTVTMATGQIARYKSGQIKRSRQIMITALPVSTLALYNAAAASGSCGFMGKYLNDAMITEITIIAIVKPRRYRTKNRGIPVCILSKGGAWWIGCVCN
ncbi:MAG: hypothetical protein LBD06_09610 [Candidatus Accumulibacter sp.]|nr:hypothetical protein [Accumulibacter sp.]